MKITLEIGITIFILFLFIWFLIQKLSKRDTNKISDVLPISLATCISEVSWEEVEKEFFRLHLNKQRNVLSLKQAYDELLQLQPNNSLETPFVLYLHLNEERNFIDVYAKEEGDFYTEYMIDKARWENILAYTISREIMDKYSKPTLVCATLFSITADGYTSNTQAPTA